MLKKEFDVARDCDVVDHLTDRGFEHAFMQILLPLTRYRPLIPERQYMDSEQYKILATIDFCYRNVPDYTEVCAIHKLLCYDKEHMDELIEYIISYLHAYAYDMELYEVYADKIQYNENDLGKYGFAYDPTTGLYRLEVYHW